MKLSYYLIVILLFSGIFTFSSCSNDNDGPSADVNISIVGDWQIAESDLNGDGARQGIVVHEDGTVTGHQRSSRLADRNMGGGTL